MPQIYGNNGTSTLAAAITNVATTITIQPGHGLRFPVVTAPDFAYCTLEDASGNIEIVQITAHTASSTSFTVVRAQQGTTARAYASGDLFEMRLTAAELTAFETDIDGLQASRSLKAGETYTGAHNFTGATLTAPTRTAGDNTTNVATTAFVTAAAFSSSLPSQTGNNGKTITTDGSAASWTAVKTINSQSLLGAGDIPVQSVLVSGTSIKTINSTSLLGSGDISITSTPSIPIVPRSSASSLTPTENGKYIQCSSASGSWTLSFNAASVLGAGWYCWIRNISNSTLFSPGVIVLDPNAAETIDSYTSVQMYPGETRLIMCNGTSFTSVVLTPFYVEFWQGATFNMPIGYSSIGVDLFGGGGGGGGGSSGVRGGRGGGGGARRTIPSMNIANGSVTITVGAGGTGGAGGASGNNGGDSSVAWGGGTITAYGGDGGTTSGSPGAGGGQASRGGSGSGGNPRVTSGSGINLGTPTYPDNIGGGGGGAPSTLSAIYGGRAEWGGGGGGYGGSSGVSATPGGGSLYAGGGGGGGAELGNSASGGPINSYSQGTVGPAGGTASSANGTWYSGGAGGNGNVAGAGSAGGFPAGGGGGGGGSGGSFAGGNGADGIVRIWGVI